MDSRWLQPWFYWITRFAQEVSSNFANKVQKYNLNFGTSKQTLKFISCQKLFEMHCKKMWDYVIFFRDAIVYGTSTFTSGVPMAMEVLSEGILYPNISEQEVLLLST